MIKRLSPNRNARPAGTKPDLVVIHGTAGRSDAGDVSWCTDPRSGVSYHYIVGRDGTVWQLVPDEERAWHAGESVWQGRPNCNDYSLGVALSNDGKEPYPEAQVRAAGELVADLCRRWGIPWERIVSHALVSPGRKTDPWLHFPWGAFFAALDRARKAQSS